MPTTIVYQHTISNPSEAGSFTFPTLQAGDTVLFMWNTVSGGGEPSMRVSLGSDVMTKLESRGFLAPGLTNTPDWAAMFGRVAVGGETNLSFKMSTSGNTAIVFIIRGRKTNDLSKHGNASGDSSGWVTTPSLSLTSGKGIYVAFFSRYESGRPANSVSMYGYAYYIDDVSSAGGHQINGGPGGSAYLGCLAVIIPVRQSPNTPSNLSLAGTAGAPASIATLTPTLSWSFSHPDGGAQGGYEVIIRKQDDNSAVCSTSEISSSTTFTLPANKLIPDTVYNYTVRVWDSYGQFSPISTAYFKTMKAPTATPTSPRGVRSTPQGTSQTPRLQWTYTDAEGHAQKSFRVQIQKLSNASVVHDVTVTSANTFYDVPARVLAAGEMYHWLVQVTDNTDMIGIWTGAQYFLTNVPPGRLLPDHIPDTKRVWKRPIFYAVVNDDVENDSQSFCIQLATDSDFTQGLLTFDSVTNKTGWEYSTNGGTNWTTFPDGGKVIAATIEGKKVRYTLQTDLVEGTTYYWRMTAKDGATGTAAEWSDQQTLINLLGTAGKMEDANLWGDYKSTHALDAANKIEGSNSMKVTIASGKTEASTFKTGMNWNNGAYYLVLGFIKNGNATSARFSIANKSQSPAVTDTTKFNLTYLKFQSTAASTENFDLNVNGAEGQYAYFDQVRVYEISKVEYDAIGIDTRYSGDILAVMYPYVDNTQTIARKTRVRCGTTLQMKLAKPIKTTAPVDRVVMSKFQTMPTVVINPKRVEDTDTAVVKTGNWVSANDAAASGGIRSYVRGPGSAELTFMGTGIRYLATKAGDCGIANIYLDDNLVAQADLYESVSQLKRAANVYENTALPYGQHKIKVEWSGNKNVASSNAYLTLDAFEILDTMQPALLIVRVANNGLDASPTWEDCTKNWNTGDYYRLTNTTKTAAGWGLDLKLTVDAKDRLDEISLDAFGISFD